MARLLAGLDERAADIVVADNAEFERLVRLLGITKAAWVSAVRHGAHHVGVDIVLNGELAAQLFAHGVHIEAVHSGVRSGEVKELEHAGSGSFGRERLVALHTVLGDDDDFAILHIADETGAGRVQRAALRSEHIGAVRRLAEDQWAQTPGVAGADEFLVGQADQRITAFDVAHRVDETVEDAGAHGAGDEVENHLCVHGRLEYRAVLHEAVAQRTGVGEVSIMRDGEAASLEICEQGLDVALSDAAGSGVAVMADGDAARQSLDSAGVLAEALADETEMAFVVKSVCFRVISGDAAGFLSAVLQGVQAERGQGGCVLVVEYAVHAAFMALGEAIGVKVVVVDWRMRGQGGMRGLVHNQSPKHVDVQALVIPLVPVQAGEWCLAPSERSLADFPSTRSLFDWRKDKACSLQ